MRACVCLHSGREMAEMGYRGPNGAFDLITARSIPILGIKGAVNVRPVKQERTPDGWSFVTTRVSQTGALNRGCDKKRGPA